MTKYDTYAILDMDVVDSPVWFVLSEILCNKKLCKALLEEEMTCHVAVELYYNTYVGAKRVFWEE